MNKKTNFYTGFELKEISDYIEKEEFETTIKIFLRDWLLTSELLSIFLRRPYIITPAKEVSYKISLIKTFIKILKKYGLKQESLNWKNYCKIMHEINNISREGYPAPLREMVQSYFRYALKSNIITNSNVKKFISDNSDLLLAEEFKRIGSKKKFSAYINNSVRTNFPINSSHDQIIQVEYVHNDGSRKVANFYLPTQNQFLINIMGEFLRSLSKKKLNGIDKRLIVTLFEESLENSKIDKFEDFKEQTFKQQLFYYTSYMKNKNVYAHISFLQFLVKFYRYIDDIYMEREGERLFRSFSFNRDLIIHKHYSFSIMQDYTIVNLNSIGMCPESDKWFVVADVNKRGTHIANSKHSLLNFELIENLEFRNVIKEYIWNLDLSYSNISSHFISLVDFLNKADSFYQEEQQLRLYNSKMSAEIKPFSSNFLNFYHADLVSNKKFADVTINSWIKVIRKFIKYIQSTYFIPDITLDQFNTINLDYNGGRPIPLEDFKEILKEMKRNFSENNEIMLIVLQLAVETKIRPGEILALERDCIISVDNSGQFGTIKYYSKTSGREKTREIFVIEHIRLLQRAIKLTQHLHEKAGDFSKNYIFLSNHGKYNDQVIPLKHSFNKAFGVISEKLYEQEKINYKYTPYNLRHTYIEKAWQMVEDGLISTLEVGIITGNTASVAKKHYRNRDNVKRYVEALYEVSILDDERLSGSILESDESINHLPPVQEGAGSCASVTCEKIDTDEDSSYKCLTCMKFVTTVERLTLFEKRMKEFKDSKDKSNTIIERDFYTVLIQLYGAYLTKMYDILGVNYEK